MPKSGDTGDAVAAALARYYDLDVSEQYDDVEMYLALAAASDGPILELACGSGRICVPLAAAGHRVTGVDRDPAMLDRARTMWAGRRKATSDGGSLDLIQADMTAVEVKERFGLVILAFNGLLLLPDRSAQEEVVRNIAGHLASDGRAVIDIWLPAPEDLVLYDGRLVTDWIREDPSMGTRVAKTTSARYSPASASATFDTQFDEWRQMDAPTRTH
ncbi:MAG: class I SAM-dependent methyltransferase, partial [Acidobacteria bacterium]|nr:class I SAM-dependent methyltransferase [Acidobacteriota bacterium]